jgi:hypothetical protein
MQTAINPALAAAMTLERAAQVGEFQPTTREGQPTVAAQLMQKAVPPAVPDVVKQAGLGGQIQAMQMQDAQQELMGRLMAQQKQAPGLMGLNPQMGNFAEGGIVGYTDGGTASTPYTSAEEIDRLNKMTPEERKAYMRIKAAQRATAQAEMPTPQAGGAPTKAATGRGIMSALKGPLGRFAPLALASGLFFTDEDEIKLLEDAERKRKQGYTEDESAKARRTPVGATPPAETVDNMATYSQEGRNYPSPLMHMERFSNVQQPSQMRALQAEAQEGGVPSLLGAAAMRKSALDLLGQLKAPPTFGEVRGQAERGATERREFERGQGLDPDYLAKELEAAKQRGQERLSYADRLAAELDERRKDEGIINFLLGARGLKGQGIGEVFRTGALSSRAAAAESRAEARKIQEMRLAYEDASVKERQSLELARRAVAAGDWKSGQDYMNSANKFHNDRTMAEAEMRKAMSGDISKEEIEKIRLSEAAKDRKIGRDVRQQSANETLLRSYDATVTTAIEKAEKILAEMHPTGKLFNTSVEARKSNPEGYRQYQADRKRLYDEMVAPAERNRKALQERLQGYAGWGQVNVQ